MHAAAVPQNEIGQRALDRWGKRLNVNQDLTAFKLDPDYQKQRIGSLMLATSSVAMSGIGVNDFYSGVLLAPAVSTYARFGITPDDFWAARSKDPRDWQSQKLPLELLAENPHVNDTIEHFLIDDEPKAENPAA